MHLESHNIKVITYDNWDEILEEIFHLLLSIYQISLETQMREIDLIFDCVKFLFCKCCKINFECDSLYIGFPGCIKKKKQQ